jgi:hypothetical protein
MDDSDHPAGICVYLTGRLQRRTTGSGGEAECGQEQDASSNHVSADLSVGRGSVGRKDGRQRARNLISLLIPVKNRAGGSPGGGPGSGLVDFGIFKLVGSARSKRATA